MKKFLSLLVCQLMILGSFFSTCFAQSEVKGINLTGDCLKGMGKDCFVYTDIIGISSLQGQDYTAFSIAQDIVIAATYMVGAVLTIVIIWCALNYIIAARGGKETNTYAKGLKNAAIGAVLVRCAYSIVRLIQYIAKG